MIFNDGLPEMEELTLFVGAPAGEIGANVFECGNNYSLLSYKTKYPRGAFIAFVSGIRKRIH
jgi:hypothetical protein